MGWFRILRPALRLRLIVNIPSPQPSPGGRGGLIGVVSDLALGFEVEANSQHSLTPTLSRRERGLDRWWFRIQRPALRLRLIVNIPSPQPSPGGRGGLIGVVSDLALGFEVEANSQHSLTPTLSRRERGLDRWWFRIQRPALRLRLLVNIPQSVPSPFGRGLG